MGGERGSASAPRPQRRAAQVWQPAHRGWRRASRDVPSERVSL